MQKFTISVADLLGRPGRYRDIGFTETLDGVSNPLARIERRPVTASLRAESVVEGILVTGPLRVTPEISCARCLRPFDEEISVEVCELFVAPGHEASADEDSYRVRGTELRLEPMIRDALALALPLHPLCRSGCKGICARCGADLNEVSCGCEDEGVDPRWAGLDAVRDMLQQRSG